MNRARTLTVKQETAARRLVDGFTWQAIADEAGVNLRTAKAWATWPEFQELVETVKAQRVEELERITKEERKKSLKDFRERQRKLGAALTNASIALVKKASDRLANIDPTSIPAPSLPAFFRAAASVAEAGSNAEAQANAVNEILKYLDANGSPETTSTADSNGSDRDRNGISEAGEAHIRAELEADAESE